MLKIIYPDKCIFCGEITDFDGDVKICDECAEFFISEYDAFCEKCGRPLDETEKASSLCENCTKTDFHFDKSLALWHYGGPNSRAVLNLKFNRSLENAETLGILCARDIKKKLAHQSLDILAPVPLHKSKMKSRGFNQAEMIAYEIGKQLQVPMNCDLLERIRKTDPQMALSAQARLENISGAMRVVQKDDVCGNVVLLIDDIFTTGSTINECAKVLKECGVRAVFCYCVCITQNKNQSFVKNFQKVL